MNQLAPLPSLATQIPALVQAAGARARTRFLEFFAANIRNKHTRRAYAQAVREFMAWCERASVPSIAEVTPLHVAAYIEQLGRERSAPTALSHLARRGPFAPSGRLAKVLNLLNASAAGHQVKSSKNA